MKYVTEMNSIIAEWKKTCVNNLALAFPKETLNKQQLSTKSWIDIISTSYDLIQEPDTISRAYSTNCFIFGVAAGPNKLAGFDRDQNVYAFYKNTFGPSLKFATDLLDQNAFAAEPNAYVILPSGTPYNNGLPASLQYITPRAMMMHTVSKNEDAHKVDDILFGKNLGIVVIKAVPELPKSALDWAAQNNVKVY